MFDFCACVCVVNGTKKNKLAGGFKQFVVWFPQQSQLSFPLDVPMNIPIYTVNLVH